MACGTATACRRMRRSTRADVTAAAPAPRIRATCPCSNHLRHSRCTVDASKCVSAAICRMGQPALLSPITTPLVKSSVCWNCLRCRRPGILCWYTSPLLQQRTLYDAFPGSDHGATIAVLRVPSLLTPSTCAGELRISHNLHYSLLCVYPALCINFWPLLGVAFSMSRSVYI